MRRQILDIINATIELVSIKRRGVASHVRREISRKVYEKQTARVEKELTDALAKHFNEAVKSAISKLKSKAGSLSNASSDKILNAIYDSDEWFDDLIDKCLPVLAKGMSESAAGFFLSLGIDPRRSKQMGIKSTATDWLESTGEELPPGIATDLPEWMQDEISEQLRESFEQPYWKDIDETTAGNIKTYLDHGINNGWSIERISKEITEAFPDEYGKRRARVVARTEAGHALNGARNAAYTRMKEQLPPEVAKSINKSWLSVLGNTTRDDHANLDGEMADEDGNFNLGGVDVPWPSHISLPPGQRINCQCSITSEFGADAPLQEIEDALADQPEEVEEPAQPVAEEPVPVPTADDDEPEQKPQSLSEKLDQNKELNKILAAVLGNGVDLDARKAELAAQDSAAEAQLSKVNKAFLKVKTKYNSQSPEYLAGLAKYKEGIAEYTKQQESFGSKRRELRELREQQLSAARAAISLPQESRMAIGVNFGKGEKVVYGSTTVEPSKAYKDKFEEANQFLSSIVKVRDGAAEDAPDKRSIEVTGYQLKNGERAFCADNRTPNVAGAYMTERDGVNTFVHELGHHLEHELGMRDKVNEFLAYRIEQAGTSDVGMAKATGINAYAPSETGNEDSFGKAFDKKESFYVGKRYENGSTEVLSMGLEKLYNDPVGFAKNDPEYFKFILGVTRGVL